MIHCKMLRSEAVCICVCVGGGVGRSNKSQNHTESIVQCVN